METQSTKELAIALAKTGNLDLVRELSPDFNECVARAREAGTQKFVLFKKADDDAPMNQDIKKLFDDLKKLVKKDDVLVVRGVGFGPMIEVEYAAAPFHGTSDNALVTFTVEVWGYNNQGNRPSKGDLKTGLVRPARLVRGKKGPYDQIFKYIQSSIKKAQKLQQGMQK